MEVSGCDVGFAATVGLGGRVTVDVGTGVGGAGVLATAVGTIGVIVEVAEGTSVATTTDVAAAFVGTIGVVVGSASDVHAIADNALVATTAPIANRNMGFGEIRIIRSLSIIEPLCQDTNAVTVLIGNQQQSRSVTETWTEEKPLIHSPATLSTAATCSGATRPKSPN